jgi:hypothetical protein
MKVHHVLAALIAVSACAVSAQTLSAVKVDAASVKVGDSVKATAMLDVTGNTINCGMRINWGDGAVTDNKINQAQDVPMVATHQYAKPGTYTVMAEPKRVGSVLKCSGKNQSVDVVVAAAAPVAVAAAPVAAAPAVAAAAPSQGQVSTDLCPEGWKLSKAGVKPSGAFTCTAPKKTKVPKEQIVCVEKLKYFADSKSGQLGCRP